MLSGWESSAAGAELTADGSSGMEGSEGDTSAWHALNTLAIKNVPASPNASLERQKRIIFFWFIRGCFKAVKLLCNPFGAG